MRPSVGLIDLLGAALAADKRLIFVLAGIAANVAMIILEVASALPGV